MASPHKSGNNVTSLHCKDTGTRMQGLRHESYDTLGISQCLFATLTNVKGSIGYMHSLVVLHLLSIAFLKHTGLQQCFK